MQTICLFLAGTKYNILLFHHTTQSTSEAHTDDMYESQENVLINGPQQTIS